jgi:D-alanine transfer protein
VREIAKRYNCSLVDFADYDGDTDFLIVPRNHLTPKGWMFYNHALDSFFHGCGS